MSDRGDVPRHDYDRIPYLVVFDDLSTYQDTYGGVTESVVLESYLLRPRGVPSKNVIVFMHPIGGGAYLPMTNALARAGHHVIYCNSRYRGVDSALIMEKVVQDLGACVKDARERLGYEKVILAGWSGGGALSLYYQQQAQHATVTATPACEPPDLTALDLPAADGMMLLAAHVSRHGTLTEWMDPSILDESDPDNRDPELDLYNASNPNQPPYSAEFLDRYRAAQIDRNRRITAWVKERLVDLRGRGEPLMERGFIVHGTMADPRWLDLTVDPSDRKLGCYLGDPRIVNMGPVGLARFTTLRSWLSQWSFDDANGDGPRCAADLAVPTLVIGNSADNACTPSHTLRLFDAVGHPDKTLHTIVGATHYYSGRDQIPRLSQAVGTITEWLAERGWAN
ncbi:MULTISPECIES: alpha/beta fold hydrolase [unclassified Gordonia (in: high G+C Gram-positive bacteria)]|uniref:alpha/beta fold hydrolase n=1 Tax=unclassified Gordonia (in: high G+C Gram-positive bacteria) TaxID=2657482 RepID=UPI00071DB147|nr:MULTISPECIES: alpha/beta fold hydrolase [unclassified Gordonia (in: high G+C Gram-positive bacteria)]KSU56620.1 alpha/beta hydrolase [Gordonia sp. SGD-V-85]SCC47230.1 Thioesterase domain-containing protein [Gordonia sp. v-85]